MYVTDQKKPIAWKKAQREWAQALAKLRVEYGEWAQLL